MKKNVFVMMVVAASLVVAVLNVHAARWNDDPANDPVYQQFLQDTADIRKEIAMDQAELDAMLAGDNPDTYKARELSAQIADNKQKLFEIARANGFAGGGCGGPRGGQATCGSGCSAANNTTGGATATCGSPSCPNAVQAQ